MTYECGTISHIYFIVVVIVSFHSSSANRIISLKEYDEMKIKTTENGTFHVMQELKIEEQCDFSNETISFLSVKFEWMTA